MEQHPVPKNVTGFQFQLVGSMTLKQFGYLAGGFLLAFVFFKSPLSFLRFPLAVFFVFLGFALAFLPVQERPLDIWIFNFLKSVYSPTQFIWQKENEPPSFLTQSLTSQKIKEGSLPLKQHKEAKEKLANYLKNLKPAEHEVLDQKEKTVLARISPLLRQKAPPQAKQSKVSPQPSPSLVCGIVKNQNQALPGIIISIKDEKGAVVRLLKSDSQGKFSSSLPLKSGLYQVEIEDPAKKYAFNKFSFRVNGQALKPWLIRPKVPYANSKS